MPFVSIEDIQPHINESCLKALQKSGVFEAVEREAGKVIRDRTGQPVPESIANRKPNADWVILPAAWIIQYIASGQVAGKSPELVGQLRDQYKEAMRILDSHALKSQKPDGSRKYSNFGCAEGLYE